jgi:hypothetical protein
MNSYDESHAKAFQTPMSAAVDSMFDQRGTSFSTWSLRDQNLLFDFNFKSRRSEGFHREKKGVANCQATSFMKHGGCVSGP